MILLFLLTIYTNFYGQRLSQSDPIRLLKVKRSAKSPGEPKWYFLKIKDGSLNGGDEQSSRTTTSSKMNQKFLFDDFSHLFSPRNYIDVNFYRAYLSPSELSALHSYSSYDNSSLGLEIFEIPDEIKSNNLNKINLKEIKPNEDDSFFVQATKEFPAIFSKYGQISKIYKDNFFFRINSSSKQIFRNQYKEIVNEFLKSNIIYSFVKAPKMDKLNRYSVGFVQTGSCLMGEHYITKKIVSKNPLFELGFTGTNEVVTVSDSGLSDRSIYFRKSSGINSDYPYDTIDLTHRKVVRYTTYQLSSTNDKSDFSGHGTHVAATVCGQSYEPDSIYSLYNGAAPDAKVFVVDLEDSKGNLILDVNLGYTMKNMTNVKSFINTNSWGSSADSLGATRSELIYNDAAVQRPDILFLFSSGNDGRFQSIGSPGSGKNVLTVGALETLETTAKLNVSSRTMTVTNNGDFEYDVYTNAAGGSFLGVRLVDLDNRYKTLQKEMTLSSVPVNIHELEFVKYAAGIADYSDQIVHVVSCAEANDAIAKTAKAIYVTGDKNTFFAIPGQCSNFGAIAFHEQSSSTTVSSMYGQLLTILPQIPDNKRNIIPAVASYSSRGPSNYGAIKPEVVAPGSNISSGSTLANNMIRVASGTSMSTPLVAGTIAVLRNYLKTKFSSIFNGANVIQSHLLKAIVVASADKPDNTVPDFKYGFGMVNLKNVIPELIGDSSTESKYFRYFTDISMIANSHYYYKFTITKDSSKSQLNNGLRVCFSYLDHTTASSSIVNIKANMNLVHVPSKKVWYPLGDKNEDYFSTVERIFVPNEEVVDGEYIIVISTSNALFTNSQRYYKTINGSIVVSGFNSISQISGKVYQTSIDSEKTELTNLWSNILCDPTNTISSAVDNSELEYGGCQCDLTKSTGLHCQFPVNQIDFNSGSTANTLNSFETVYFVSEVTSSSVNSMNFSWEQKPTSVSYGTTNYLMLRMDIGKSYQRVSHYDYFYASNKTTAVIGGPTDSYGQPITFAKGTKVYYAFTNFGEKTVNLKTSVTASFITNKGLNPPRRSNYTSILVSAFVVVAIIIFIVVLVNYCRKKKKKNSNNRIEGQTTSSSSSSSSSLRRRRLQNYPPGSQPPPNTMYFQTAGGTAAVIVTTNNNPQRRHKKRHHSSSSSSSSSIQNIGNYNNNNNNAAYYYAPGQYPNYSQEPGSPAYFPPPQPNPVPYNPQNPHQQMPPGSNASAVGGATPPAYMVSPQAQAQQMQMQQQQQMQMQMQQQNMMNNGYYANQTPTNIAGAPNSIQSPYTQPNVGYQPNPYDIP